MDKRIKIISAAAVLVCVLAGCGSSVENTNDDAPVAGGAVTKVTTKAAETEASENGEAETKASENGEAGTEAPEGKENPDEEETEAPAEDSEPETAQSYEDSMTAAFIDKLEGRNFSVTRAVYRIDNNEGMELQFEDRLEVNGDNCHKTMNYADGTLFDTYCIGGMGYQVDTEKGEYRGGIVTDIGGSLLYPAVLGFDPTFADFVSAESYSDGTVQERFSSAGTEYVITCLNGNIISVEGNNTLYDIKGFSEDGVGEIKLPEGLKEVSADPDGDGNVNVGG